MAYIGRSVDIGNFEKQVLTPDSSTTTFTLSFGVGSANSLLVVYGGVIQEPNVAYALSGGGLQIVFSEAPVTGTTLYIIYLGKQLTTVRAAGQETTKQTFTGDSVVTQFTLNDPPVVPAGIMVFVDGILQREGVGANYVSSGSTINFSTAPDSGAEIDVYTLVKEKVSIDTVADGSITRAKLAQSAPYWDAQGNVGINVAAPQSIIDAATSSNTRVSLKTAGTGVSPGVDFWRARGTIAAPTVANGSAVLGSTNYFGYDGTSYIISSQLRADQSGNISTGVLQSDLIYLNADTSGTLTERFRIDSKGNVGLGGITNANWSTNFSVLSLNPSKVDAVQGGLRTFFYGNGYENQAGDTIRISDGYFTRYNMDSAAGYHQWFVGATGNAGTTVTSTVGMKLTSNGTLAIGTQTSGWSYTGFTSTDPILSTVGISIGNDSTSNLYMRKTSAGVYQLQTTNSGANTGELHLQPYGGTLMFGGTSSSGGIAGTNLHFNAPTGNANKLNFQVNGSSTGYVYNNATETAIGAPSGGTMKFQIGGSGIDAVKIDQYSQLITRNRMIVGSGMTGENGYATYSPSTFQLPIGTYGTGSPVNYYNWVGRLCKFSKDSGQDARFVATIYSRGDYNYSYMVAETHIDIAMWNNSNSVYEFWAREVSGMTDVKFAMDSSGYVYYYFPHLWTQTHFMVVHALNGYVDLAIGNTEYHTFSVPWKTVSAGTQTNTETSWGS